MRRRIDLNSIEDDLDIETEYDIDTQQQTEQLVQSMYCVPKQGTVDIPDTKNYIESTIDEYEEVVTDELLCRAYTAAKKALNVSDKYMSSSLGITVYRYKKLLDGNTKFAMAVQSGIIDGRQELYDDLTISLYKLATGRFVVEEVKTETQDVLSTIGKKIGEAQKTTVTRRRVPPDAKVAQRLLARLDPSWKQTSDSVDANMQLAQELKVTEDVTMSVDPTKLPPDVLRLLITSNTKGIQSADVVGGSEVLQVKSKEQKELHNKLKTDSQNLNEVLPEKELNKDSVVTPQELNQIKRKRGRPKKNKETDK